MSPNLCQANSSIKRMIYERRFIDSRVRTDRVRTQWTNKYYEFVGTERGTPSAVWGKSEKNYPRSTFRGQIQQIRMLSVLLEDEPKQVINW